ncbi:MAG: exodeoxyribonuclease VII large subunit [Pseudomonadota bacterium]
MASTAPNVAEYSVSELSGALKRSVEDQFGHVRVRGEISQFKRAASGHCYFRLKDENANLDAIIWRGVAGRLPLRPEDGLEVVATGKVTTYPARSSYQIVIESLIPAGKGALMALLEERKRKLSAAGLFAPERKQPLPFLPDVIGIITSPTGAVIRDMLHRLADRFPRHVLVWPVAVQGDAAAEQIAAAIDGFHHLPQHIPTPDVLIVARGGGSLEDLWAFNEEIVVRAVAAATIPVISAVGHETDTTLIDFAADKRAPTPTAAAEMAVPVRDDLIYTVQTMAARQARGLSRRLQERVDKLSGLARGLPKPQEVLAQKEQRLDDVAARLNAAARLRFEQTQTHFKGVSARLHPRLIDRLSHQLELRLRDLHSRHSRSLNQVVSVKTQLLVSAARQLRHRPISRNADKAQADIEAVFARLSRATSEALQQRRRGLESAQRMLLTLSYQATLQRGYAIVTDASGGVVRSVSSVPAGGEVSIELADGHIDATVSADTRRPAQPIQPAAKRRAKPAPPPEQGNLF